MLKLAFAPATTSPPALTGRPVNTWRTDLGEPFAQAFVEDGLHVIAWRDLGVFSFSLDAPHVTVWPERAAPAPLVADMFARVIQPVILQAMGWQALHASAIAHAGGAIVFCGVGHTGKSTLAYAAALTPGITQVADDAILLEVGERSVTLQPLPFRPKLRSPSHVHLAKTSGCDPDTVETRTEGRPTGIRAIFILAQAESAPRLPAAERLPATGAFRELLRHAHCFDDHDRARSRDLIEAYLTIAGTVPVYRLTYRPDLGALDELSRLVIHTGLAPIEHPVAPAGDRVAPC